MDMRKATAGICERQNIFGNTVNIIMSYITIGSTLFSFLIHNSFNEVIYLLSICETARGTISL